MKKPLLTVAIPVFERDQYFSRALQSALSQTPVCEILVWDNGSSHDRFRDTCAQFGERVRYYKSKNNEGMFANWNKCLASACTEFVLILGDDDILNPEFSARFESVLKKHPRLDYYCSNFIYLHEASKTLEVGDFPMPSGLCSGQDVAEFAVCMGLGLPTISMAIRKSGFLPYYEGFTASNDWLALYGNLQNKLFFCDDFFGVAYRKHDQSDSLLFKFRNAYSHAAIMLQLGAFLEMNGSEILALKAASEGRAILRWLRVKLGRRRYKSLVDYYAKDVLNPYFNIFKNCGIEYGADISLRNYIEYLMKDAWKKFFIRKPSVVKSAAPVSSAWIRKIDTV